MQGPFLVYTWSPWKKHSQWLNKNINIDKQAAAPPHDKHAELETDVKDFLKDCLRHLGFTILQKHKARQRQEVPSPRHNHLPTTLEISTGNRSWRREEYNIKYNISMMCSMKRTILCSFHEKISVMIGLHSSSWISVRLNMVHMSPGRMKWGTRKPLTRILQIMRSLLDNGPASCAVLLCRKTQASILYNKTKLQFH